MLKTFLLKNQSWGRMEGSEGYFTVQLHLTLRAAITEHYLLFRLSQWYGNFLEKLVFLYPDKKFPTFRIRKFITIQIKAYHLENPEPVNFGPHFHPLFTYFLSNYARDPRIILPLESIRMSYIPTLSSRATLATNPIVFPALSL